MIFRYVAYNAQAGVVKGKLDRRYESEVREEIHRQGLKPLSIRAGRGAPSVETLFPSLFKVKGAELVRFCRQLSTMMASGGNLLRALEMLEREAPGRVMRNTLISIRRTLDDGGSLSEALAEHPNVFNPLFISVVEVGEYTGRLGPALEQLADILEQEQEAKSAAIRTLMYPAAIIGLSLVTLAVMLTVAMPPLLSVFEDMDAEIPLMTRVMVAGMGMITENFQQIGIGLVVAILAVAMIRRIPRTKYVMDRLMLRMPLLGTFIIAGELARFSRTITMLLESGVTLSNAVHLGISGCNNSELKYAFTEAEASLMAGHGLADALRQFRVFPVMFMELLMLGEESNALERTMKDAAEAYHKQMQQLLNALLGMLEPLSTLVVGGIVGILAFSMFVPIYSGLNAVQ